ncbi:IS3 family transposase [Embleya hyalina]|uniref:IS3 family transposase n=1 Tax=Embleya hyalina TaxID=516124 RepID=UPI000F849356|nr:IS3 family transposase [Embleya hyalina]
MPKRYTQQFKDEAVRLVLDGPRPIVQVARELGVNDTTLGNWVAQYRRSLTDPGSTPRGDEPVTARERELERENRKLREENAFLGKSKRLLRPQPSVSSRYELVDAEKATFRIADMCRWLDVSRSGYYEWRTRPESTTARRRHRLTTAIREIFAANHETYGYRRVHAVLARSGEAASPELVRALMRGLGLVPCQPRPWRAVTTRTGGAHPRIPDLVRRDFTADRPGARLVGDVTYIPTWEGFLYLATVIDCHSKAVVGWAMADHFKTSLVTAALDMARGRVKIGKGAIFHSDRGSNYTSEEFARTLAGHDMRQSVGRTGVCWDNAMAESFFGALKNEYLNRYVFTNHAKARREVVRYIEGFYNRRRLHSALGYRTPLEALRDHDELGLAA